MTLPTRTKRRSPLSKPVRVVGRVLLVLRVIRRTPGLTIRRTVRMALWTRRQIRRIQGVPGQLWVAAAGAVTAAVVALVARRRRGVPEQPPPPRPPSPAPSAAQSGGAQSLDVDGPNESAPGHDVRSPSNAVSAENAPDAAEGPPQE